MKVLQIASYYGINRLYSYLFDSLDGQNISQEVYIPVRHEKFLDANKLDLKNAEYYYSNILKKKDKFLYLSKINKQKKDLESKNIDFNSISIIHAHTWYSDGGTAYLLSKKYDIPYIIGVRSTDINVFFKLALHLRSFAYKVMLNASQIICISHAYKEKLFSILPKSIVEKIKEKVIVIPNGIDNVWLEKTEFNISNTKLPNKTIRLIFTGSLEKRKNLIKVLNYVKYHKDNFGEISLSVVGEGPDKEDYIRFVNEHDISENIEFLGYLKPENLKVVMEKSDIFIMLSLEETFGISYIEAISQGVPVIYTKNEGIYGFYKEGHIGYGLKTDSNNSEIKNVLDKIIENYSTVSNNCVIESKAFSWEKVANKYIDIYLKEGKLIVDKKRGK